MGPIVPWPDALVVLSQAHEQVGGLAAKMLGYPALLFVDEVDDGLFDQDRGVNAGDLGLLVPQPRDERIGFGLILRATAAVEVPGGRLRVRMGSKSRSRISDTRRPVMACSSQDRMT